MASFSALHEDLVYEILCASPNLAVLASLIKLSSKQTFRVYCAHKRTVLYKVVSKVAGPDLLGVLKVAFRSREPCGPFNSTDAIKDALTTMTKHERYMVESVGETLDKFEPLYSQTRKDRRFTESVLTLTEASRLRHALCIAWDLTQTSDEMADNARFHEDEDEAADLSVAMVKEVLSECNKAELMDLVGVCVFLQQLRLWSHRARSHFVHHLYPSQHVNPSDLEALNWPLVSPETVMALHLGKDVRFGYGAIDWTFFVTAVNQISSENDYGLNVTALQEARDAILEERHGMNDTCAKCNQVRGVELFGRSNWSLLRDHLPVQYLCGALEGNLTRNSAELRYISDHFRKGHNEQPRRVFDWAAFVEENLDLVQAEEGAQCSWDKNQWYCKECLSGLLRLQFRKWWTVKKKEEGIPLGQDCWYGYNCRVQGDNAAHMALLNHLCEPTRGDDVAMPQGPAGSPVAIDLAAYP